MCYNYKISVPVIVLTLLTQTLADLQGKLNPRIANGYPCNTTRVPYYVIIRHQAACGGSLITYNWVLTAAHCLIPRVFKGVIATIHSSHDMSPEFKQVRKVKEVHSHPNYDEKAFYSITDLRYDIGLVLADEPFRETATTRVVSLPAPGFTKQCNQVMLAGTGETYEKENGGVIPPEQRPLKCVNLSIIDSNSCRKNYSKVTHFDTTHIICTFGSQGIEGSCKGDSGGPLICDNVVIGTDSGAGKCEPRTKPEFYAMVESYLDFIYHLIKPTGLIIKYARTNGTSVGGQKPSDKSPVNVVQVRVPNRKLIICTLLYFFLLYP